MIILRRNYMATADPIPTYLDPASPREERVRDLLSRLTLEEKISLMANGAKGVPRLGIPAYDYWSEALHGVARNGRATVFPQAIGMAATWDPDLLHRIANAISDEGRAKYHAALKRKGFTSIYQGLTFWSPNVNIFRDPRWGRGQETYGEDPYLTGEMGVAFVRGLQGDDPDHLKAAACAKHYAVHSGPEALRHVFDAVPSKRDLYDTYLPAFKKLVMDAKVEAVMGAYNAVYGVPCNASEFMLNHTLREEWGFEGHVVSDCGAISDIHLNHKYTQDADESAAAAIKAGCDLSCDHVYYDNIGTAIERGLMSEADVDLAISRTLGTRFKLGMFDPEGQAPYASIPMSVVDCPEHRQLAYDAAVKSIVLLKNNKNVLPIAPDTSSIMVTGPNAPAVNVLLGNYYGFNGRMITMLEGITDALPEGMGMEYHQGMLLTESGNCNNWAFPMAASAGLTIACMGISPLMEGEEGEALLVEHGGDRTSIELPQAQIEYLRKLNIAGARVVLVLFGGSPVALGDAEDLVEAIIQVWYPGQEGGRAVADVLFGKASPSGKLPITFPKATSQLPPFEEYSMRDRTYRYATWEPLYPFGFGLSYTTFAYSNLKLNQVALKAGAPLEFSVTLTNTGSQPGEEVAQVYLSDLEASTVVPLHKLVAFQRVKLPAGECQELHFKLEAESMKFINDDGEAVLEPGKFRLTVGGCAPGKQGVALGAPQPVSAEFSVK
jgi:beta-glucosidase